MLDIIIPTYKNKEGLQQTLSSIDFSLQPEITVTVIDDCSELYYQDILEQYPGLQMFYSLQNEGPGNARQYGIKVTKEPYITFIDTDDTFLNNEVQSMILNTIKENPDKVVFSWQYNINNKVSQNTNNRLHGRVYKRSFIEEYGIEFCAASSYTNEDIGFNRLCRLIIRDKKLPYLVFQEPVIDYRQRKDSITNRNNGEFFFRQQNKGLSLNSIHTLKIAEKNHLSEAIILDELNAIMCGLYYTFLCTAYERPEFLQESWEGAKLFYDECFRHYKNNTIEALINGYSAYVRRIYLRARTWKNFKPLNLGKFLQDLNSYKSVPYWYIF